jgi:hypothetical protein
VVLRELFISIAIRTPNPTPPHVIWYTGTNIAEGPPLRFLWNAGIYPPNYTVSSQKRVIFMREVGLHRFPVMNC